MIEYVSEMAVAAGIAVRTGTEAPVLGMVEGHILPVITTVPMQYGTFDAGPPLCSVDGVAVDELAVLVKPVAFFVTTDSGTHEVSRCYFHKGKFQYGVDMQRLGGIGTRSVEYFPGRGLQIHFERGYEMFIPMSHCQATWRLPESS